MPQNDYISLQIACFSGFVLTELGKLKLGIILKNPSDSPLTGEDEEVLAPEVLNPFCIVGETKSFRIETLIIDPTDLLIGEICSAKIATVFALKTVLKNLKLKHADNADDNALKTGVRLEEYLYSTLLCYLIHSLCKLLTLH